MGSGSSPGQATNNEEALALHGIKLGSGSGDHKEAVLLREVESKQKQLKAQQQELMKAKEIVQMKGSGPTATPESKSALEDAKNQLRTARSVCDRISKELAGVRKRYADEVAQKRTATQQPSIQDKSQVRPMTIDSLELQHQGFCLVKALIKNDSAYLQDHTDIFRAFRWLWRSRGRYLRMQHEESVPPRYHGESQALGSFLINYSEYSPSDIDLLFELIRIFLQPGTSDFLFIRRFLYQAARDRLAEEQKKQVIERFFVLMGGDSSDEIKTLSLQFVIYPSLYFSFHEKLPIVSSEENETTLGASNKEHGGFVDEATVHKFISEVLFKNHKPAAGDDRLVAGFLQISDLFLEFVPQCFAGKRDDMLNFCWTQWRNDSPSCKCWALFVICRCVVALDTPQRVILQVFDALLQSRQVDGKKLIQSGLDMLVSGFQQKLDESGLKLAVDSTIKVMFEEANSTAQLSRIFHVIICKPDIFYHKRSVLAPFMVNSLNRLGLPPNSPAENRTLAVSMVDLVVTWESGDGKTEGVENAMDTSAEVSSATSSPDVPVHFDTSMVETIINFLVRLKILLADPKVDNTAVNAQPLLDLLLQTALKKWKGVLIRPVYLEKVVSMCNENEQVHARAKLVQNTKSHNSRNPRSPSGRILGKQDGINKSVAALHGILFACLDIFKFLALADPSNRFFLENPSQLVSILGACLRIASMPGETELRQKLFDFLIPYLSTLASDAPVIDERVVQSITVWVEKILIDTEVEHRTGISPSSGDSSRHASLRQVPPIQCSDSEDGPAVFALKVIKTVGETAPSFSKTFTSSLLTVLGTIVKQHTLQAASNQKQNGVNYNAQAGTVSIRHMYPTPTFGMLEEASLAAQPLVGIGKPMEDTHPFPYNEVKNGDSSLLLATMILDISILDMSDNIQLMLVTVNLVGKWLIAGDSGPLTGKEQTAFLWKIASFDFPGISEIASQPLVEVVSYYVKALLQHCQSEAPKHASDDHEMTLMRSVSACLVAANMETRDTMLDIFLQDSSDPFHVLWRFFNGDLEGLGGRHWVTVLVELLVRIIIPRARHGETSKELQPPVTSKDSKQSENAALTLSEYLFFAERMQQDGLDMTPESGGHELNLALRRLSMAERIESFLSRPYHSQSFKKDFSAADIPQNSIKSFLAVLTKLDPLPIFDVNLLMSLARSYNCWYEVLLMLESQYSALSTVSVSDAGKKQCDMLLLGMRHCYSELGEADVRTSLVLKSCNVPGSKYAASLDIYGRVDKALETYSGLIELVESEESAEASEFEMDFWEERWVNLQQQQQQLEVVSEYAKQSRNEKVMLECAWRERDWDKVRSLCSSGPIIAKVESGDPAMKICETLSAVAEGKLGDVENLHAQASQLALYRWQFLPTLSTGSSAHATLLHYFHRLVEIRESGQIMVETNNHSSGKTLPDLKNLLK
ncbi:MAG: hypothetical protein SGILL_000416 [Bacillariaceae sp.]